MIEIFLGIILGVSIFIAAVEVPRVAKAIERLATAHERLAASHENLQKGVWELNGRAGDAIEKTFHSVR
jgi:hypothetical protein